MGLAEVMVANHRVYDQVIRMLIAWMLG